MQRPNAVPTLFLIVSLSVGASAHVVGDDSIDKEFQRLQGKWLLVKFELQAVAASLPDDAAQRTLTVDGRKATLVIRKQTIISKWSVDPGKTPKALDEKFENGEMKGKTCRAIYELSGDTLKICAGAAESERPENVTSAPGTGLCVLTFKRIK